MRVYEHMLGTLALEKEEVVRDKDNEEGIKGLCKINKDQLIMTSWQS